MVLFATLELAGDAKRTSVIVAQLQLIILSFRRWLASQDPRYPGSVGSLVITSGQGGSASGV
ncbi:hypothetical protein PLA107_034560 (plasmid) [Pseudomonas amygdali pv. lachrymans str. M301315]|uniref:Uncharacterized protein n=1 Tax=Pseudomonas amygdali pv. lachrymans str. M301315 TaxID=629260 RepID=A0AAD0VAG9_PSEAV|nr:hypothetical protein PLA107_034560 [Pseudomonas amygdali pv. lachrymans str. M301315]